MTSLIFYIVASAVLLALLLWFVVLHRAGSQKLKPRLRYDHRLDFASFLSVQPVDLELLPQLFDSGDVQYLKRFPFAAAEVEHLRMGRRRILKQFLKLLKKDFDEMLYVHQYLARHAQRLNKQHEIAIFKERVRFAWKYWMVQLWLRSGGFLSPPGLSRVLSLAKVVENWRRAAEEKLGILDPTQLEELRENLNVRLVQAQVS